VPEGIDGFLDTFGIERIGEVRLADNNGDYEVHIIPGEGNIDFNNLFTRLESTGYKGHYSMAYGSDEQRIDSRNQLSTLV
jgi:sugar phosphate isomerase/epimerase